MSDYKYNGITCFTDIGPIVRTPWFQLSNAIWFILSDTVFLYINELDRWHYIRLFTFHARCLGIKIFKHFHGFYPVSFNNRLRQPSLKYDPWDSWPPNYIISVLLQTAWDLDGIFIYVRLYIQRKNAWHWSIIYPYTCTSILLKIFWHTLFDNAF